ncbi:MAG: energy transducer TonB, partial [Dysgonamonadaceae bacterium]|nr:energy transducer TonB [Dysgonamonadaceae bacterium]
MKLDRDNAIAIIGTILFHLAIFVLMFFTLLKTVVPIEEEGILVNIGTIQTSAGFFESQEKTAPAPEPEPVPVPEKIQTPPPSVPTAKDELVTQDKEESLSLANRKKEKDREKRETAERKREAERKEREAERMAQEAKDA